MSKSICGCCDDLWHEKHNEELTKGDYFFLVLINAGGFNHLYVDDIRKSTAKCLRKTVKKFLKLGVIYIAYKNKKDYGNGLVQFTQKGVKYFIKANNE